MVAGFGSRVCAVQHPLQGFEFRGGYWANSEHTRPDFGLGFQVKINLPIIKLFSLRSEAVRAQRLVRDADFGVQFSGTCMHP